VHLYRNLDVGRQLKQFIDSTGGLWQQGEARQAVSRSGRLSDALE